MARLVAFYENWIWMSPAAALRAGFTNHGSYYGLPVWMSDDERPLVGAKSGLLNVLVPVISAIELSLVWMTGQQHEWAGFMFYLGPRIEDTHAS
jgi:hypothetical protein